MLRVRGLRKVYADGQVALEGVDLDIEEGMTGLLGPNGAGKTTFMSLVALAREPSAGSLWLEGLDPARPSQRGEYRRRIGFLPQEFEPVGFLTAAEYLEHVARLRGLPAGRRLRERVTDLLDAVGLADAARRRAGEFSGGMKRRLGIAQALVHAPRLVIVDEPTSGLDPEERIRFRNLVCDVADATAVLLSTHVVEDVEATCPRVVVIARGRVRFDGPPAELLERAAGRLWDLPASAPLEGLRVVGRHVGEDGGARLTAWAEEPPPGAVPRDPVLDEAYSAFLASEGETADGELPS